MAKDDSEEDRKARIEKLKRKIEEMTGEKPVSIGSGECSPELKEKFWEYVLAFEEGQHSPLFDTLVNGGLSLPAPDELDDADLTRKLWEVIYALALLGVFLHHTDHLNDRELYEDLWHDALREEVFIQPGNQNYAYHIDMIGSGSDEDLFVFLTYLCVSPCLLRESLYSCFFYIIKFKISAYKIPTSQPATMSER